MDHKTLVASLPADLRADLTRTSTAAGLRHLAGHLGAILLTGSLVAMRVPFWPLLLPVHGVLLVFLFTLEHEATHKTPFAHGALNDWVGRACGLVLVLPFEWFRWFHLAHHRWTNLPGKDPELDSAKPATRAAWLWHVSGLPYWIAALRLMADLVRGRVTGAYVPAGAVARVVREARAMAVLYALALATLAFSPLLLWLWIVPVLLGQPFLRLCLLAEHGDCPQVADMLENTRTTFTTRAVRFLAWNMPFHVEHHSYPTVPFHRLPQLHRHMRTHLRVTADGYAAFTRDYLARRR
jgi:fatty acid desaturase